MSFSSEIKDLLSTIPIKKNCCRKALLYGLLSPQSVFSEGHFAFSTDNENVSTLLSRLFKQSYAITPGFEMSGEHAGESQHCKLKPLSAEERALFPPEFPQEEVTACDTCLYHFLRGLFLSGGTVSDPTKKGYHLEFLIREERLGKTVFSLMEEQGFSPKLTLRRGKQSLYFKNSESIEDFLTAIGAPHAALDLMNAKILRDIRNNENRRSNCDTSNIYRATGAADLQIRAIRKLIDCGKLSLLPNELQLTAKIRLQNPECSLLEIAALHEPPLTKSGVNHRMKKIMDFADNN